MTAYEQQIQDQASEIAALSAALEESLGERSEEDKDKETLPNELDRLALEHDQLTQELATRTGELARTSSKIEDLEASLKASRGALTPLPEGDRALRAEVIGLRGRLDETREENTRLQTERDETATELSIARARLEDLSREIEVGRQQDETLQRELAERDQALESATAQGRETPSSPISRTGWPRSRLAARG